LYPLDGKALQSNAGEKLKGLNTSTRNIFSKDMECTLTFATAKLLPKAFIKSENSDKESVPSSL
jgi:hypothetical protein